mgnify:CR=1 FL=1
MSSNIWERFDTIAKPEEVAEVKSSFSPTPAGKYRVRLEQLEPSESQTGLPMLKGRFRIIATNRIVFYNQLLQNLNNPEMTKFNVGEAVKFLEGLIKEDIDFVGLSQLADIATSIPLGEEYTIQVSYGKKDLEMKYPKIKILEETEVFEEDTEF